MTNGHLRFCWSVFDLSGESVSIHMDSVSAGRQGKWHFIEPCHSSGSTRVPCSRVRNKPFTPCLLFQVQSASALLKVNRLKWQSWALPCPALIESCVPVGEGATVGCRITGTLPRWPSTPSSKRGRCGVSCHPVTCNDYPIKTILSFKVLALCGF